jgi:hypothetical protein
MPSNEATGRVSVTDLNMPFWSMVRFMVKWAVASIPAFLILIVLGIAFWLSVGAVGSSLTNWTHPRASSKEPNSIQQSGSESGKTDAEIAAYLPNVEIQNATVSKSTLGDDGVFGEVKNLGDRTLKRVEITIYCQDKDGKVIFEKTDTPVLVTDLGFGNNQPLKPGYARQFGVRLNDAPSEWAHKVDVKVTSIKFE